ncbi:MAG: EAL domain-containing protein [Pacificimonas sp.]
MRRRSCFLPSFALTALISAAMALMFVGGPVHAETGYSFSEQIAAAKAAMMGDPGEALSRAREARRLAILSGRNGSRTQLEAAWLEGEALTRLNRAGEARPVLEQALTLIERMDPGSKLHGDLLKAFASAARMTEDTVSALTSLHRAHDIFRDVDEPRAQAIVLQNLGMLHIEATDYDRAEHYFDQADQVFADDAALAVGSHTNRGRIAEERSDFNQAIESYQSALAIAQTLDSDMLQSRILTNLAFAQLRAGDVSRARQTSEKALALNQAEDAGGADVLLALKSRLALMQGDRREALRLIDEAFDGIDTETTTALYLEAHETARRVYAETGAADRALLHFTAYDRLKEEATKVAARANAALMSARFDSANRTATISRLESEKMKKDRDLERSKLQNERLLLGGLAAILILIGAYGLHSLAASRKRHREIVKTNAQLVHAAEHDALTGLANRTRCYATLNRMLAAPRRGGQEIALFMLDLDEFKEVNDTMGHHAGDLVLKEVSARLSRIVAKGDHIARLGGDEFAIIVSSATSDAALRGYADRIIAEMTETILLPEGQVRLGCSIGVARPDYTNGDGATPDGLTRNADLALYAAKDAGRGQHRFFEPSMLDASESRRRMLADLKDALEQGQFSVHYQPIVSAETETLVAYEALLRWRHPELGNISPDVFIPLAEDAGLIPEIGGWVLRTACEAALNWDDDVVIAVNVSPLQFDDSLSARVLNALAATGLPPRRLQLEVTESVFMRGADRTANELARLGAIGVSLALDDFGTGYSSLGYLQRAAFAKIKIDRSFVTQAGEGCRESIAIIRAIIALADSLGMITTAEGIETLEEADLLRTYGCTQFQGYFYGKPAPAKIGHCVPGSAPSTGQLPTTVGQPRALPAPDASRVQAV